MVTVAPNARETLDYENKMLLGLIPKVVDTVNETPDFADNVLVGWVEEFLRYRNSNKELIAMTDEGFIIQVEAEVQLLERFIATLDGNDSLFAMSWRNQFNQNISLVQSLLSD